MQFCFTRIIGKEMLEAHYRSEKDLCILENSQNTAPIGTTGPRRAHGAGFSETGSRRALDPGSHNAQKRRPRERQGFGIG